MRILPPQPAAAPVPRRARCGALLAALALTAFARPAVGQSLAERIRSAPDGEVELRFPSRPNVCGYGSRTIGVGREMMIGVFDGGVSTEWRRDCLPGDVHATLTLAGGTVTRARVRVDPDSATDARTALGLVDPQQAADYLLDLAPHLDRRSADAALLGAMLARGATVVPGLLVLARDSSVERSTRQNAMFWLGRLASAAVNGYPGWTEVDSADARGTRDDERTQAVFALSQMPHHAGVPDLMQVARTNRDPHLRSAALFWLGQSGDPRAIDLFEDLLRGGR